MLTQVFIDNGYPNIGVLFAVNSFYKLYSK